MRGRKRIILLLLTGFMGLHGCGSSASGSAAVPGPEIENAAGDERKPETENAFVYESSMELQYAENFTVDYYEGG